MDEPVGFDAEEYAPLEVTQFIPEYPSRDDPRFSYLLSKKREFQRLKLGRAAAPRRPGRPALLKHQIFLQRFLSEHTPYDRVLVYHETGVGKTCAALAVQEGMKHRAVQRPALILVKNEALARVFQGELARHCPRTGYVPQPTEKETRDLADLSDVSDPRPPHARAGKHSLFEMRNKAGKLIRWYYLCTRCGKISNAQSWSEKVQWTVWKGDGSGCEHAVTLMQRSHYHRRLRDLVRAFYEIMTYGAFVKNHGNGSDEYFQKHFSNRVIIIDEAHNIRLRPAKSAKTLYGEAPTPDAKEAEAAAKPSKGKSPAGGSLELQNVRRRYRAIYRMLHAARHSKQLLLTATPMWDEAYEIAALMNLIMPAEQALPTRQSTFNELVFDAKTQMLKPAARRTLLAAWRGRVSFLRSAPPNVRRVDMENRTLKPPWVPPPALRVALGRAPNSMYASRMSAFQSRVSAAARSRAQPSQYFDPKTRQMKVRNIPGGHVQRDAREAALLVWPDGSYGIGDAKGGGAPATAFSKHVTRPASKSALFPAGQARYVLSPAVKAKLREKGLAEYSAVFAAILGEIFAHRDQLVFVFTEAVRGAGALLLGQLLTLFGREHGGYAQVNAPPAPDASKRRFAIVTSDAATASTANQVSAILDAFNADDNATGDRIQVIIGGRMISEGITLKNVQQVHTIAYWNFPQLDQATGRAIRHATHDALIRLRAAAGDKTPVVVRMFTHVAVPAAQAPRPAEGPARPESIHEKMVHVSVEKDYRQRKLRRVLKVASVDCPLNYPRNVIAGDRPRSRECDYTDCNYACDGYPRKLRSEARAVWAYSVPADAIDDSTYNLFYAARALADLADRLAALFRQRSAMHFDDIAAAVRRDGGPPVHETLLLQTLEHLVDSRRALRNRLGFAAYLKEEGNVFFLDTTLSGVASYLASTYVAIPLAVEQVPLEELIETRHLERDFRPVKQFCAAASPRDPALRLFAEMSYKTQIILLENAYALRRRGEDSAAIAHVLSSYGGQVVAVAPAGGGGAAEAVHRLYDSEFYGEAYGVTAQHIRASGHTRLFLPREGVWTTIADPEEEERYLEHVRRARTAARAAVSLDKFGFAGTFSAQDQTFRIQVLKEEKPGAAKKKTRAVNRGKACDVSWSDDHLRALFGQAGHLPAANARARSKARETLIAEIEPSQYRGLIPRGWLVDPDWAARGGKAQLKDTVSLDLLRRFSTFGDMDKKALCEELERFLRSEGLVRDIW